MIETWKDIEGYEGFYQISNFGNVKSVARFFPLALTSDKVRFRKETLLRPNSDGGYPKVTLYRNGVGKGYLVHRLVTAAFLGKCEKGIQVCHSDGNPLNNNIQNLRYGDAKENARDRILHGRQLFGENHKKSKLTEKQVLEIREKLSKGINQRKIAKDFNVSQSAISMINRKISWKNNEQNDYCS